MAVLRSLHSCRRPRHLKMEESARVVCKRTLIVQDQRSQQALASRGDLLHLKNGQFQMNLILNLFNLLSFSLKGEGLTQGQSSQKRNMSTTILTQEIKMALSLIKLAFIRNPGLSS